MELKLLIIICVYFVYTLIHMFKLHQRIAMLECEVDLLKLRNDNIVEALEGISSVICEEIEEDEE